MACTSGRAGAPEPSATRSSSPRPPPPVAPLTGLVAASEAVAERPVLAVKIDNHFAARPQIGLDRTDIVYEEPVEGGITRFIAIFQSRNARSVGPIRSARLADIDVLGDHGKPILAFSGAAGYVLRALERANLVLIPHGRFGSIYRRDSGRPAPHNLFSATSSLYRAARGEGATGARTLFAFGALPLPPAPQTTWKSGVRASIPFSSPTWTAVWRYDPDSGVYRRSHGSSAHRTTGGARVTARNVLVMRVRPGEGATAVRVIGSGKAVLLRQGVRVDGRWSRPTARDRTTFEDAGGRPFVLAPGNTWVELVPTRVAPSYR